MMKRKMRIVLGVMMVMALVGCGQAKDDSSQGDNTAENSVEAGDNEEAETQDVALVAGQIQLNGVLLSVGENVTDDLIAQVGEPVEVLDAPSCHYDGMDTIYTYDDFVLYAYQDGEDKPLYIIELDTDKVATKEGVTVGMTSEQVMEIFGDACVNEGSFLSYAEGEYTTDCFLDDNNIVSYIELY